MNINRKQRIQNQLRQYLKDYRNINGLSAEQAAKKLSVEIATYRTMEGKKPQNRVLSVLEYIENIAKLNKMTLTDFVLFLERNQRTESGSNVAKRELFEWEMDLLDRFDKIGIPIRNRFIADLKAIPQEDLQETIKCFVNMVSLSESKRKLLFNIVKEMGSHE